MHSVIKKMAWTFLPRRTHAALLSRKWWDYNRVFLAEQGITPIVHRFVERHGTTVLHGPFEGLKYPLECAMTRYSTVNLMGTYEMELHPWFYDLSPGKYEQIIDIGASEGYYAVGMALRSRTQVTAYDTAGISREYCRQMATLNGVADLVNIRSWCTQQDLKRLRGKRCLVLSDCEGYEVELFSEPVIQALKNSDVIIELHENTIQGAGAKVCDALSTRFSATHSVELVGVKPRDPSQFPELAFLEGGALKAIGEFGREGDQQWLIAKPKNS